MRTSAPLPAYDAVRAATAQEWVLGDPEATREAILAVVDAPEPPRRVFFGQPLKDVEEIYADRLQTWREWEPLALRAFGRPDLVDAA